ncbi:MAG: Na+/H+ antiporter NhaC family protein [Sphingobacteriaceae bacterium]|nr:Na+/H+ antiporter NhaC family protein [Sphingobacteriaceae bacterium]
MKVHKSWLWLLLGGLLLLNGYESKAEVRVDWPTHVMQGLAFEVVLEDLGPIDSIEVLLNGEKMQLPVLMGVARLTQTLNTAADIRLEVHDQAFVRSYNPIPLAWSIWPPLLAIFIALLFREVYSALLAGILLGGWVIGGYQLGVGAGLWFAIRQFADTYLIEALSDGDHQAIIVFSMLIGGMVAVISRNGGMQGVVNILARRARNAQSGQFVTWLLGVAIFFDDYSNTLLVGNTMRPVTDKLRISREKLSYLVDSTAAPVAAIAFITTWIGAELGYIKDGINSIADLDENAYTVFLSSLSYSFYPILTLIFMLMLIKQGRDYGPMLAAETKARANAPGEVHAQAQLSGEADAFQMEPGLKPMAALALVPVLTVIGVVIWGLLHTGWDQEVWNDTSLPFYRRLSLIIGNANSYTALLWGSFAGLLVAVLGSLASKRLSLEKSVEAAITGFKTMLGAVLILSLAWVLASITKELETATYITNALLSLDVGPGWIPVITFLLAGVVAFSTGSSWGTMAILYPLMLPASWKLCMEAGMDHEAALAIFHNVVSCVLAGSVLGDHCSPISDTTILSSLASGCNHIDHVRTQLPYALTVGAVAIVFGTIPAAFGMPVYLSYLLALPALWLIVRYFGKRVLLPSGE